MSLVPTDLPSLETSPMSGFLPIALTVLVALWALETLAFLLSYRSSRSSELSGTSRVDPMA